LSATGSTLRIAFAALSAWDNPVKGASLSSTVSKFIIKKLKYFESLIWVICLDKNTLNLILAGEEQL
jgi:hypothetical protein